MHYVQMQENLKRVRAIGSKDAKKENISGFIKRVPQTWLWRLSRYPVAH